MPGSNPPAAKQIDFGTYTGNGGVNRQITTGFRCSAVLVHRAFVNAFICIQTTNDVLLEGTPAINLQDVLVLKHATDGFIVTGNANLNLGVWYYWAISE